MYGRKKIVDKNLVISIFLQKSGYQFFRDRISERILVHTCTVPPLTAQPPPSAVRRCPLAPWGSWLAHRPAEAHTHATISLRLVGTVEELGGTTPQQPAQLVPSARLVGRRARQRVRKDGLARWERDGWRLGGDGWIRVWVAWVACWVAWSCGLGLGLGLG